MLLGDSLSNIKDQCRNRRLFDALFRGSFLLEKEGEALPFKMGVAMLGES